MSSHRVAVRTRTHRHPMRVVTRRTGLSAELLRIWERRYRVVTPARTQTGRRLYSDAEIERLRLLHQATLGGRSIGLIASLSTPALVQLLRQDTDTDPARAEVNARSKVDDPPGRFVKQCLRAVEKFDPDVLDALLHRASIALSAMVFLEHVVTSLLDQAASRVREGTLRSVHGHLTATVVRRVLERITVWAPAPAPKLLLATVTGQPNVPGSMIAAAAAASEGWSVTWLDANLPADDIFEAAERLRVRAVGVTLLHPAGDAAVNDELRRLRSLLPRSVVLFASGAAASGYADVLEEIGAVSIKDLNALITLLRELAAKARAVRRARKS